jgi:hypothetical protein
VTSKAAPAKATDAGSLTPGRLIDKREYVFLEQDLEEILLAR